MSPDISRCPYCLCATPAMPCQGCGWQLGQDNAPPALALGRVLDGRYRIGRVLGHGGFGITYLAWDDNLQLRLAIKEYLPRESATRAPDGVSLSVFSGQAGEQFAYGLDGFLAEARALARFDQHPGIVTVKNFFRAHGTGYCVMDYVEGITLRQYLDQQPGGRMSVDSALKLLTPVMDALRAVHQAGLIHRDIAPDNIYLSQDGRIRLLDFGAARFAAGEHSKSLSVILKPGYAPEEQYRAKGKQGPWTDVYGLAATFYRAITGQVPPESLDRLDNDDLVPPSRLGIAIKPEQEATLLKALAIKANQRYQDIAELQQAWQTRCAPPKNVQVPDQVPTPPENPLVSQPALPVTRARLGLKFAMGSLLVMLVLVGMAIWQFLPDNAQPVISAPQAKPDTSVSVPPSSSPPPATTPTAIPMDDSVRKPRLYALLTGVSDYDDDRFDLTFPAKDARDFGAVLQRQSGGLYQEVVTRILQNPTKQELLDGLDWLRDKVTLTDVAVFYISGHGVNHPDGDYYFLTRDSDPERLNRTAVSSFDFKKTLLALPSKVLVFLETCHAGNFIKSQQEDYKITMASKKIPVISLPGQQEKSVSSPSKGLAAQEAKFSSVISDLISAENGVVIFAATTGDQFPLENPEWGNGAFTKALMEGFDGAANYTQDGRITINQLDLYLSERVKALTGNRQTPTTTKPQNITDFPIALKR